MKNGALWLVILLGILLFGGFIAWTVVTIQTTNNTIEHDTAPEWFPYDQYPDESEIDQPCPYGRIFIRGQGCAPQAEADSDYINEVKTTCIESGGSFVDCNCPDGEPQCGECQACDCGLTHGYSLTRGCVKYELN